MRKPNSNSVMREVLWLQFIKNPQRFVYHMIMKARYFHKPKLKTLRAPLLAMRSHKVTNNVSLISMPLVECGLDYRDWQKVKDTIKEGFHGSTVQMTVLTLPVVAEQPDAEVELTCETPTSAENIHDDEISSALQTARQNDKALNLFHQWVTERSPLITTELQGCILAAWQLANQLKILEIKGDKGCRIFE